MAPEDLQDLPKIELHNHLDGGLRVATVIDLADEIGYDRLPSTDEDELARWFYRGGSGSLEQYLAGFEHTIAVMQTESAIERVAFEAAIDMHADGVIYGEVRFAPVLNTRAGLRREDAISAALAGFRRAHADTGLTVRLIVDAMRNLPDSEADAKAAALFVDRGVVAFDLAGPEAGYPAGDHEAACRIAATAGLHLTVHAGEADGVRSIGEALHLCGAERLGHGVRIADELADTRPTGPTAEYVRDMQIPLEVCPTSNLHTLGIDAADHPVGRLVRAGFNVTLNTDNRLMSNVTLTDEFALAMQYQGLSIDDLRRVTQSSAGAAFVSDSERRDLRARIEAGYASLSESQPAT